MGVTVICGKGVLRAASRARTVGAGRRERKEPAMRKLPAVLFVAATLVLPVALACAETLPFPDNLIALDSDEGGKLLAGAEEADDFLPLSLQFVTQAHPAFCGVATLVMILNALQLPTAPASPMTTGIGMFDQNNV